MLEDRKSLFNFFSLAVVISGGGGNIQVFPVEELPFTSGDLKEYKDDFKAQNVKDAKGVPRSSSTTATVSLTATWLPLCASNRMTAPDVCPNESVYVYRYADSEQYYWTSLFNEPMLRRLEHVKYMFSNQKEPMVVADDESSYTVVVSTRDKKIHIKTAKNDEEFAKYDILLDTKKGEFSLKDDRDNFIFLESKKDLITVQACKKIELKDKRGNYIRLDSQADTVILKASKATRIEAPKLHVTGDITCGGNMDVNGVVKAKAFVLK